MAKRNAKNWRTQGRAREYGEVTSRIDPSVMRTAEQRLDFERQAELQRRLKGPLLPKSMRDVKQDPKTYVVPKFVK